MYTTSSAALCTLHAAERGQRTTRAGSPLLALWREREREREMAEPPPIWEFDDSPCDSDSDSDSDTDAPAAAPPCLLRQPTLLSELTDFAARLPSGTAGGSTPRRWSS